MHLKITCPACACRYAVIGAAYLCLACEHNAPGQVFARTISGIRQPLEALPARPKIETPTPTVPSPYNRTLTRR